MKKCIECGKELLPEWKFCPECGEEVYSLQEKAENGDAEAQYLFGHSFYLKKIMRTHCVGSEDLPNRIIGRRNLLLACVIKKTRAWRKITSSP